VPVLAPEVFVWSKDRLFGNIRAAFLELAAGQQQE
jgi:hypothetical protein